MSMLDIFSSFVAKDDSACRAAFEAAMKTKIETEGYKMSDLMYEVFRCQSSVQALTLAVEQLAKAPASKQASKPKPKKK